MLLVSYHMKFRPCYTKIWHLGIFYILNGTFEKTADVYFDPLLTLRPEVGHNTPKWEVLSLWEQRCVLKSRDKRMPERLQIGLAKFSPVYYTHLMLLDLLYFFTTIHSSSNLGWKHSGFTVSSDLDFLMKAPMFLKTYISKFMCFLLLLCLGQFNFPS